MSNSRSFLRAQRARYLDAPIYPGELVPVEESELVRHPCGHEVLWRLLPGVSAAWAEVRGLFVQPCPCCGGEVGPEAWERRYGRPCPEWPDHVALAGVGVAHCHRQDQTCESVKRRHKLGLATVDNEADRRRPL